MHRNWNGYKKAELTIIYSGMNIPRESLTNGVPMVAIPSYCQ
jgi:UDP:flavonoid glycosyltransferase YjiC (YdhE family)